jgi:glycosyltransferase involved in cell wall biosynthesis
MTVSLIVTSYDRQSDLDRLSESISCQTCEETIEIIFVAQGTAEFRIPRSTKHDLRLAVRTTGGLTPLSKARNIGVKDTSGDIIGFPDDDCWYEPELLQNVVRYFDLHPDVDCVCTNVFDPDRRLSLGRRPVDVTKRVSFFNVFRYPTSAGFFFRRRAFVAAGGKFNEDLGAGTERGAAEDTEIIARLLKRSLIVDYVGAIKVYHRVPHYLPSDVTKYYTYGRGSGYLYGLLLKERRVSVTISLLNLMGRSCAGMVRHSLHPTLRCVYWSRLLGVISGLCEGWTARSQKDQAPAVC